eukprot:3751977-Amphidinium_carterae.1
MNRFNKRVDVVTEFPEPRKVVLELPRPARHCTAATHVLQASVEVAPVDKTNQSRFVKGMDVPFLAQTAPVPHVMQADASRKASKNRKPLHDVCGPVLPSDNPETFVN